MRAVKARRRTTRQEKLRKRTERAAGHPVIKIAPCLACGRTKQVPKETGLCYTPSCVRRRDKDKEA